ncbi:MAG: hypothetical protein WBP61_10965 [Nocardioides sp.]
MAHRRARAVAYLTVGVLSLGLLAAAVTLPGLTDRSGSGGARLSDAEGSSPVPGATGPVTPQAAPGSGPLGLKWSWGQPETFDFVASAAGGWTFLEVEWCHVQPDPGTFDWTRVDSVVREARALGYETMLKLRTGQCWATEPPSAARRDTTENTTKTPSTPATDEAAYLAFVRETVRRYAARGVDDYAVENEPDVVNLWSAPVVDYERLAIRVAAAVHDVHPGAHVLDAGASSTAYGVAMAAASIDQDPDAALRTYQAYYARRIDGGMSRFPAVADVNELQRVLASEPAQRAVQAVETGIRLANSDAFDAYQLHFYEDPAQLPELLGYLGGRLQDDVPIEAWEVGVAWPGATYDEQVQAEDVFRLVGSLLDGGVRRIVYLPAAYSPAPEKVQVFRGLTHADGEMLPAGQGWVALATALKGLHDAPVASAGGELRGATWRIGQRQAALLWSSGGQVSLDADDVDQVVDASGAVVEGPPVIGSAPVLVLGSAGGELARQVGAGVG